MHVVFNVSSIYRSNGHKYIMNTTVINVIYLQHVVDITFTFNEQKLNIIRYGEYEYTRFMYSNLVQAKIRIRDSYSIIMFNFWI